MREHAMNYHLSRLLFAALMLLSALPALAQVDPPGRVGRLAYLENNVNFRVDANDRGGPASLNWPLTSGAILETGDRSRAEVWVGSTAFRMPDRSQVEFPLIADDRIDVRMNDGALTVSVQDNDQANDIYINTPDGYVRFQSPGRYRIDVLGDHSRLTVLSGHATFGDNYRATSLQTGQQMDRWSNGTERLDIDRNQDDFDRWVDNREYAMAANNSRRYVSPHMTGYQDLDNYGAWRSVPEYGQVWYPESIPQDWAPYRYGRWAWVAPWGWTWVDNMPWGFAPFHYGRWAVIDNRWGWIPGEPRQRPVYAPALVGWVGKPNWNLSFSIGSSPAVGWFPLAPREVYVPSYRYSPRYVERVNACNVTNVQIIHQTVRNYNTTPAQFAFRDQPRAVTVVPANIMRDGRPIGRNDFRAPDRRDLHQAPAARQAPDRNWIAPAASAVRPSGNETQPNGSWYRRNDKRNEATQPLPGFMPNHAQGQAQEQRATPDRNQWRAQTQQPWGQQQNNPQPLNSDNRPQRQGIPAPSTEGFRINNGRDTPKFGIPSGQIRPDDMRIAEPQRPMQMQDQQRAQQQRAEQQARQEQQRAQQMQEQHRAQQQRAEQQARQEQQRAQQMQEQHRAQQQRAEQQARQEQQRAQQMQDQQRAQQQRAEQQARQEQQRAQQMQEQQRAQQQRAEQQARQEQQRAQQMQEQHRAQQQRAEQQARQEQQRAQQMQDQQRAQQQRAEQQARQEQQRAQQQMQEQQRAQQQRAQQIEQGGQQNPRRPNRQQGDENDPREWRR
jgi:hypothetical protein